MAVQQVPVQVAGAGDWHMATTYLLYPVSTTQSQWVQAVQWAQQVPLAGSTPAPICLPMAEVLVQVDLGLAAAEAAGVLLVTVLQAV